MPGAEPARQGRKRHEDQGFLQELRRRGVIRVAIACVATGAVPPFVDTSAAHDQQYLGDGIADESLNALASIARLNVATRTYSRAVCGVQARSCGCRHGRG